MKLYKIHTKDDVVLVEAENRDYAFAKYFKDIAQEKVSLDKIGDLPNAFLAWHATEYADPADDLAEFVERMKRWKLMTQEAHTT